MSPDGAARRNGSLNRMSVGGRDGATAAAAGLDGAGAAATQD